MLKKISLLIAAAVCLIAAGNPGRVYAQPKDTHFYFIQITDTHFGDGNYLDRLQKIVDSINALPMPIECVVHTGDISNNNIENEKSVDAGLAVLKQLKVPVHFLPGNHDILPQRLDATLQAYRRKFGDLSSSATYRGVVFLFAFTENIRKSYSIPGYDALQWLERSLKASGGKPVIVFHHAPSVRDFYSNEFHQAWQEAVPSWKKLLNSYNVKAVIAGHFHRDELHWIGNVPLYVSASVTGYWGRQATYRIYEYDNGRISYRTQYIESN